jgi:flagellar motor switch protein FliN/FliY
MSTANQTALEPRLKALEQFARCLADGLRNRVEAEVQDPSVTLASTSLASVLNEAANGALLGRAIVGADGATAGLLWVSGAQALLSAVPTNLTELSPDDVRTLNDALQACCEETGEEPPPVEWSPLEPVSAEEAARALRELGVAEECERARVSVMAGETEFVLHFVAASEEGGAEQTSEPDAVAEEPSAQATNEDDELEATLMDDSLTASPEMGGESPLNEGSPTDPGASEEELPDDLSNLHHLLDVRIPLTIRLGTTRMTLDDILRISKGTIVELQQREEEPLEVLANGRVIARGQVVVVDDRFGLRITEIGDPAERVRATR